MLKRAVGDVRVGIHPLQQPFSVLPDLSRRVLDGLRHSMSKGFPPTPNVAPPLGRIGSLEVRLATTQREVKTAQKLRYKVFYEEMAAIPDLQAQISRRDRDAFDAICDHLLVIDHAARGHLGEPAIVGTYRLLRQDMAEASAAGFYSANEFDIAPLIERHAQLRFLELGRSCVLAPYRGKRTVELLWHGIWSYVLAHGIDVMIGCASLEGTDTSRLAVPLSFLHHHAKAPAPWRVAARLGRRVAMDMLPTEQLDAMTALRQMPPLLKGYLRLGAFIGDGAVVDRQFNTTDVLVVLPVSAINARYVNHYGAEATRYAA